MNKRMVFDLTNDMTAIISRAFKHYVVFILHLLHSIHVAASAQPLSLASVQPPSIFPCACDHAKSMRSQPKSDQLYP